MNVNSILNTYSQPFIESKIEKKKHHIDHLKGALGQRKTHGGKRYRARQISIQEQIQTASKEFELLNQQAKKVARVKSPKVPFVDIIIPEKKVSKPKQEDLDLYELISDELLDPVFFEIMENAVVLSPCGHTFNQETLDTISNLGKIFCPLCRALTESTVPDRLVRTLVKHYQAMQNPKVFEEGLEQIKKDLLDPITKSPMTEAIILDPCGHSMNAVAKLGKNLCCSTLFEHSLPHYTARKLASLISPQEVKLEDHADLKKLTETLTQDDFKRIGEYIGEIFKSTVKIPTPRTTVSQYWSNDDRQIVMAYHSHPPVFYHNYISLILAATIRKEFQTETKTREYSHLLFLFKIKNDGNTSLFDKILPHVPIDFKIQLEIDPVKNANAKEKEDLIFTITITENDKKKTKSFAIKDLILYFPSI